jgi:hypothetical protein
MTQADRVHSTPRNDSSSNRPMFPPVAAAQDSSKPSPAIGQPESQMLTSESAKAAGSLSRRLMLAGLAAFAAALPAAAAEPDPIFATIELHRELSIEEGYQAVDLRRCLFPKSCKILEGNTPRGRLPGAGGLRSQTASRAWST